MQGNKLISVIVAAYNIEAYLPRCLDSLLAQTYRPIQVIVVDDGAKDTTPEICDKYAAEHEEIQVIHRANGGLSAARNTGLLAAKGDYIGYVDGDDWIEPNMYEKMLTACEEQGAELAVCAYRQVGDGAENPEFSKQQYILSREEALGTYICDDKPYHIYNSVWSKLFRRDIIEGVKFPEGKKSEDILYTTHALLKAEKCVFLDSPFYNYVVSREDSIMNQGLAERRFQDEIPFWREQAVCFKEAGYGELALKAGYHFYRRMLFYYVDFRERKMKEAAGRLADMLRKEKEEIAGIYANAFVAAGDKTRMKLFLCSPGAYYLTVKLYDKIIIPLRQH